MSKLPISLCYTLLTGAISSVGELAVYTGTVDGSTPSSRTLPYSDKQKQREYQRAWVARRRATWFVGKSCEHCSSVVDLDVHHLDPATKESHHIWGWSRERMELELSKCIVLCGKCHIEEHKRMRRSEDYHGTYRGYRSFKCKCALCLKANADRSVKRRKELNAGREV